MHVHTHIHTYNTCRYMSRRRKKKKRIKKGEGQAYSLQSKGQRKGRQRHHVLGKCSDQTGPLMNIP